MAEELLDWADPRFLGHLLAHHPAPTYSPVTGEKLWDGIRLHGAQRPILYDRYRFKKVDGGVRFGKSEIAALALYTDYMWRTTIRGIQNDRWAVVADSYAMATAEMEHLHRLLTEASVPHDFNTPVNQSWRITFPHNDCRVSTITASDVTKIASYPYRGIVIAEAAQTVPEAWQQARLRVAETRGWVLLEGTFEKQKGPWYAQLTEQWRRPGAVGMRYAGPSYDNIVVFPGGRDDPEILSIEANNPPAVFREKIEGEPQLPSNIVFPEANSFYVLRRRFPSLGTSYDDERPVYLAIDPGIAHAYAVLAVQFWPSEEYLATTKPGVGSIAAGPFGEPAGNVAHVVDVIYRWGRETEHIVEEAAARPWARNVNDAVLDFAARQRRAEGPPVIEQWAKFWARETGRTLWCHAEPVPLQPGYDGHRRALLNAWSEEAAGIAFNRDGRLRRVVNPAGPRLYIDPDCAPAFFGGFVDGQQYAGEYHLHVNDIDRQGMVRADVPRDMNNDAIKALNYLLYWWFQPGRQRHRGVGIYSAPLELTFG